MQQNPEIPKLLPLKGKWKMAYNKRMHYLLCNHITHYTMGLPNTLQIKSTNNAIENTENIVYMSFK